MKVCLDFPSTTGKLNFADSLSHFYRVPIPAKFFFQTIHNKDEMIYEMDHI